MIEWNLKIQNVRRKNYYEVTGTTSAGSATARAKLSVKASPEEIKALVEYLQELVRAFFSMRP